MGESQTFQTLHNHNIYIHYEYKLELNRKNRETKTNCSHVYRFPVLKK